MRRFYLPLLLVFVTAVGVAVGTAWYRLSPICSGGGSADRGSLLEGTWRLTSSRFVYPSGDDIRQTDFPKPALRIQTAHYYAFGRQGSDGRLEGAGGGAYEVRGDTLIEHHDYHIAGSFVGETIRMQYRVDVARLVIAGRTPNGIRFTETYERLE